MCSPDHYEVSYEINPWMNKSIETAKKSAWTQWKHLHHFILRLGGWVEYVHPQKGFPDMVFTANAGLIKDKRCVLSHFRYKERQGEEPAFKNWFIEHGYEVCELKDCFFEGEGDALFAGDRLFAACGFRSDRASHQKIKSFFELKKVIACELINPYFYHLDTCFAPIDQDTAIYFPQAFSADSIEQMQKEIKLIPIEEEEAKKFACNCVILGKDIIIPAGCFKTCDLLNNLGFNTHQVELDEFIKAGGAAKCLTLKL